MKAEHNFNLDEELSDSNLSGETSVVSYVLAKADDWQTHLESNYLRQWEEFNRIWRGKWDASDKTRNAERSRIVTPATQQAVESSVCEIEEATFGQGKYFDIREDVRDVPPQPQQPPQPQGPPQGPQNPAGAQGPQGPQAQPQQQPPKPPDEMQILKKTLNQEFVKNRVRAAVTEVLCNAAVYGTGIAEVVVEEIEEKKPMTQSVMEGQMTAYGVYTENKVAVTMRPILPKNFYIDPTATTVDTAHGCVIDEFVPRHQVLALQRSGVYRQEFLGTAAPDTDIEPDPELAVYAYEDKVRIQKYFGLVPRHMIEMANMSDEDLAEREDDEDDQEDLIEAIVVIGNEGVLLKAEESPYMMGDRPIVAFQWDVIPGLFHGRGIVEKGYNSQKALDAEIRARIDALALTVHPMMGIDATRIPRGHKPEVRAGKNILTNGNPKDVLMPFKLGDVSQITFAQAAELQAMVQQSTGAVDSSGVGGGVNSEATAAGISMSLGAIIKRQKRTLVNFQENFWIRYVEKSAWRYMQFDPENFPVKDYNFIATSSLGIMAREYEVSQLVQLLQTTSDKSPMYGALVTSVVENMNVSNREDLIEILEKSSQPDPEQVKQQKEMHALEMELKKGQVQYVQAQAFESKSRGDKYVAEKEAVPLETQIKKIEAITRNINQGTQDDDEFAKRLQIADVRLKERGLNIQEEGMRANNKDREAMSE
jgi:hypothetical protein